MANDYAFRVPGAWRRPPDPLNAITGKRLYAASGLKILVAVVDGTGPVDLMGATVEAVFARGGTVVTGAPVIADPAAGGIGVPIPALDGGIWRMQVRVSIWGETQTVVDGPIVIRESA